MASDGNTGCGCALYGNGMSACAPAVEDVVGTGRKQLKTSSNG